MTTTTDASNKTEIITRAYGRNVAQTLSFQTFFSRFKILNFYSPCVHKKTPVQPHRSSGAVPSWSQVKKLKAKEKTPSFEQKTLKTLYKNTTKN